MAAGLPGGGPAEPRGLVQGTRPSASTRACGLLGQEARPAHPEGPRASAGPALGQLRRPGEPALQLAAHPGPRGPHRLRGRPRVGAPAPPRRLLAGTGACDAGVRTTLPRVAPKGLIVGAVTLHRNPPTEMENP